MGCQRGPLPCPAAGGNREDLEGGLGQPGACPAASHAHCHAPVTPLLPGLLPGSEPPAAAAAGLSGGEHCPRSSRDPGTPKHPKPARRRGESGEILSWSLEPDRPTRRTQQARQGRVGRECSLVGWTGHISFFRGTPEPVEAPRGGRDLPGMPPGQRRLLLAGHSKLGHHGVTSFCKAPTFLCMHRDLFSWAFRVDGKLLRRAFPYPHLHPKPSFLVFEQVRPELEPAQLWAAS